MEYCYAKEVEGKRVHDHFHKSKSMGGTTSSPSAARCLWVAGPIIIGAGPSGLAVAACLKQRGLPSLILERANCIASLWKLKTYDRLRLHLPKQFCELPFMPFPDNFPTYPTKEQFVAYLEDYKAHFGLEPVFNATVVSAEFDAQCGLWRVKTTKQDHDDDDDDEDEYVSRWVVVATGENADEVVPMIEGMDDFGGPIMHTSSYKSGRLFRDKSVLVVGCGNSGMEVCLDLCNYNAYPSLVVRDSIHVLPHEMLGRSTFGLSMWLLKWLPVYLVDRFLLLISYFVLGDTGKLGLQRPDIGPLELKGRYGKTPVLDVGTLAKIKTGNIKVCPAIKRLTYRAAEFVDGREQKFDAVILATGYKSNVPQWLKEKEFFSEKDGLPRQSFPGGWKGERGLYAVGFTKRGLFGASFDARRVAEDIEHNWKVEAKAFVALATAAGSTALPQSYSLGTILKE